MSFLHSMCSCVLSTRDVSRLAEGGGDNRLGLQEGQPAVTQSPKGPSRAGCGCIGDCHSPVALWAKIAQREVGSFHMNKVCTGLVFVTSKPPASTVLSDSSAHGSPFREQRPQGLA